MTFNGPDRIRTTVRDVFVSPIRRFLRSRRYIPMRVTKDKWDREYQSGQWDLLKNLSQLAHYSVIAGYCRFLKPGGSVFDVGCGPGILQQAVAPYGYCRYLGVDLSQEAIALASTRGDEKTVFVSADVTTYGTNDRFDMIIFNECLCYLDDPVAVLKKYESFLESEGLFVVSLYGSKISTHIWKMLDAAYMAKDQVDLTHVSGTSWTIQVIKP